jgi:Sec1 family
MHAGLREATYDVPATMHCRAQEFGARNLQLRCTPTCLGRLRPIQLSVCLSRPAEPHPAVCLCVSAGCAASSCLSVCTPAGGAIDAMVLLDRSVDLVSPLCTQLTYEGLIDEVFQIHNGIVQVETNGEPGTARRSPRRRTALSTPTCEIPMSRP